MELTFICCIVWMALFTFRNTTVFSSPLKFVCGLRKSTPEKQFEKDCTSFEKDLKNYCTNKNIKKDIECDESMVSDILTGRTKDKRRMVQIYLEEKLNFKRQKLKNGNAIAARDALVQTVFETLDNLAIRVANFYLLDSYNLDFDILWNLYKNLFLNKSDDVAIQSNFLRLINENYEKMELSAIGEYQIRIFFENLQPDRDVKCGLFFYFGKCVKNLKAGGSETDVTKNVIHEFETEVRNFALKSFPTRDKLIRRMLNLDITSFLRRIARKEIYAAQNDFSRLAANDHVTRRKMLYRDAINYQVESLYYDGVPVHIKASAKDKEAFDREYRTAIDNILKM